MPGPHVAAPGFFLPRELVPQDGLAHQRQEALELRAFQLPPAAVPPPRSQRREHRDLFPLSPLTGSPSALLSIIGGPSA
ncbi:MAG: hypothetical protein U5Q44_01605 [Dehalococcoidia bacterium]|nr:hypothetical protein [Dehalococcoidia bacterium]